jgi:hypothetical protein
VISSLLMCALPVHSCAACTTYVVVSSEQCRRTSHLWANSSIESAWPSDPVGETWAAGLSSVVAIGSLPMDLPC